jgi:hypothetical protein
MPPTPPVSLSDEVLIHRLGEVLSRSAPDDPAPWNLVATLGPEQGELRARATQLIETSQALQRGRRAPARPWLRYLVLVLAGLVLAAAVSYSVWPAPKRDGVAPVEADRPFPLPFPLFTTQAGRIVTYQHGKLTGLHVVRAPADVSMDVSAGSLRGWNQRGHFRSALAAPYADQYFIAGCLMMDDRYLYIGAHVGDPWAMRSASEPKATIDGGWLGGSIQLRLATDLDHVWPVQAAHDTAKLNHLTLWSYQGRAYLHIAHGMDFKDKVTPLASPAPGYEAHFSKTDNDQGYVVKCRVAWKLLGLEKAPYGRELGLSWDVLWSDRTGQEFVAKLTDFYHPAALRDLRDTTPELELLPGKMSYRTATIWGKAICPAAP